MRGIAPHNLSPVYGGALNPILPLYMEGHCPLTYPLKMPLLRYLKEKIYKNFLVINFYFK